MIRFILKSVFWLSLAFIVMPKILNHNTDNNAQRENARISLPPKDKIDDIITASQTAAEVGGFCYNNPALCIEGKNILSAAGSGLLDSSGKLLDFLSDQFRGEKAQETPARMDATHHSSQPATNSAPLPRQRP